MLYEDMLRSDSGEVGQLVYAQFSRALGLPEDAIRSTMAMNTKPDPSGKEKRRHTAASLCDYRDVNCTTRSDGTREFVGLPPTRFVLWSVWWQ